MANEFELIPNPDSTPGAVSTGYQLQNTHIISDRVGMDHSVVTGGTGECVLEISGPVDVNGETYTCNAQVTFTLSTAGKYYIHLAGSGANLTPTIGTGANTFDADKNARYTDTGSYRVLNWVIYYDGTTAYVHRLTNPVNDTNDYGDVGFFEETFLSSNGTWTAERSKYYKITVGNPTQNVSAIKRIFIVAGDTWTFSTSSVNPNYNSSFTNGTSTITCNWASPSTYNISGHDYIQQVNFLTTSGVSQGGVLIQG